MTAAHEEEWALEPGLEQPDPIEGEQPIEGQEAPTLTETEKLAAELGWKPEADWKGDKSNWTPADQYIRATFQKQQDGASRIKETTRHLRASQRATDEAQLRLERLERATNQLMSTQEARHRAELEHYYEQAKKDAAKAGNDDLYDELVDQKRQAEQQLDRQFKQEPEVDYTQQAQQMLEDPVVGRFLRKNAWVVQDEEAYSFAFSVAEDLAQAGYPKSLQIREVEKALREEYPERFTAGAANGAAQRQTAPVQAAAEEDELDPVPNFDAPQAERETPVQDPQTGRFVPKQDAHLYQQPQRRAPAQVQAGSRLPSGARMSDDQKAWASLPEEARRIFTEQKKSGAIKMDLKTYAKIYNGENTNVIE